MEKETARQHYLENFKRENDKVSDLFESDIDKVGTEIVDLLKEKDLHTNKRMQVFNMHIT